MDSHDLRWLEAESFAYLDINHDGVITPGELARRVEEGGLSPTEAQATESSRLAMTVPGSCPRDPVTPEPPTPRNCLVALRLGIFYVLYPAVIAYLWFYYIPTRSIPK